MVGHLEPAAGHDSGVVMSAQMVIEPLCVAAGPAREGGDAMFGRRAVEVVARGKEVIEQRRG